jgi:predicted RNA-binding protein with PIN domain
MSIHIIIDGYNLIRQSKHLRLLDLQNMQSGREALVDMLAAYKKLKPHRITVVFDGTHALYPAPPRDRIKGISIVFSRSGESADTVIKRLARKERERVLVVSSDRDVVHAAASYGAATIGAEKFEDTIAMAVPRHNGEGDDNDLGGWIPTTKKKGPAKKLPKKQRKNKIKIGKL